MPGCECCFGVAGVCGSQILGHQPFQGIANWGLILTDFNRLYRSMEDQLEFLLLLFGGIYVGESFSWNAKFSERAVVRWTHS